MKHIKIYLISLLALLIIAISPIGLKVLASGASYYGYRTQGVSGSLWSGTISVESLHINQTDFKVVAQNIKINDISLLSKSIEDINVKSVEVNINNIKNITKGSGSGHFPWVIHTAKISDMRISFSNLLKPLSLTNLEYKNKDNTHTMHFKYKGRMHTINSKSISQGIDTLITINIDNQFGKLNLFGAINPNQIKFNSTDDSSIQGIDLHYDIAAEQLNFKVDHHSDNLSILAESFVNPDSFSLVIDHLISSYETLKMDISGSYQSNNHQVDLSGSINTSKFSLKNTKEDSMIIKGHINNISHLTHVAKGEVDFKAQYTPGEEPTIVIHSPQLEVPLFTLDDVQISYQPTSHHYPLKLSAQQIRNPLLTLENPTLQMQVKDNIYSFTGFSLANELSQKIVIEVEKTPDELLVHIPQTKIQHPENTRWSIKQNAPIHISHQSIKVPSICLSSNKKNNICLAAQYNFNNQAWNLQNKTQNFHLYFDTQGLIDLDNEIIIDHANIQGSSSWHGIGENITSVTGHYDISDISGHILNIVPEFPFPIDYNFTDGHLSWMGGPSADIHGKLSSRQGEINIRTQPDGINIWSKNLHTEFGKNHIDANMHLLFHDSRLTGNIDILSLALLPDDPDAFTMLPQDIKITGQIPTPKPAASLTTNIALSANNAPADIFGFTGIMTGNLQYNLPLGGVESVTGQVNFENPSLRLLNRKIHFDRLKLTYQEQDITDGNIDISLSQPATFSSSGQTASTGYIDVSVTGRLQSPVFEINTRPINLSELETITHLFHLSEQLPAGNENYTILELISGLTRNESIPVLLNTLNSFANTLQMDVSIRTGFQEQQNLSENIIGSEIVFTKQLFSSEKLHASIRHPFSHDASDTYALNYRFTPSVSLESSITKEIWQLNLFYNN